MVTLETIRKPVAEDLEAFDGFVAQQFNAEGELLSDMLRYALSSRGKGIRPTLVLLSALLNAPSPDGGAGRRAYLAALLVEMIHITSLIHDDVIDEADTRRGKPSVNARWQSHKAVLLGDYILARTMSIGMTSGQYDLVTHICGTMATLCEGEMLQSDRASHRAMTRSDYFDIIRKKTASLIAVSASAGAMAAGAPRERTTLMHHFGEALGMAFQIQDDILDYTRTARTGKPANNDLREGKVTLPLLHVLLKNDAPEREEMTRLLQNDTLSDAEILRLQAYARDNGGIDYAFDRMTALRHEAAALLAGLPCSDASEALLGILDYIIARDH